MNRHARIDRDMLGNSDVWSKLVSGRRLLRVWSLDPFSNILYHSGGPGSLFLIRPLLPFRDSLSLCKLHPMSRRFSGEMRSIVNT